MTCDPGAGLSEDHDVVPNNDRLEPGPVAWRAGLRAVAASVTFRVKHGGIPVPESGVWRP